jgi:hypothetical protein
MKYTSFDPTLTGSVYEDLWGMDLTWLKGKAGSTFMSNYNRTVLTTPFHSAFWESFGYQCEGTKRWFMLTPEDALPVVRLHNIFTQMKDCNGRADVEAFTFPTRTDPDTMFYFPPYWAHSVETRDGLSVLLNYRALGLKRILKENPYVGALTLSSLVYYGTFFGSWDPDEVAFYYKTGKEPARNGTSGARSSFGILGSLFNIIDAVYKKLD